MKYGCQDYDINRLCRFDRRAIDSMCKGCKRTTDKEYLVKNNLWINEISHNDTNFDYAIITTNIG